MKFGSPLVIGAACGAAAVFSSNVDATVAEPEVVNVFFVDDDARPGGDGSTWDEAFDALPLALEEARESLLPAVIYVAGGIYTPAGPRPGTPADATFELDNVEAIVGGFVPGQLDPGERDLADPAARTWLVGDPVAPPRHVMTVAPATHPVLVDGLAFVGGVGGTDVGGGGMVIEAADVTVVGSHFFGHETLSGNATGGAIAITGGSLRAVNSVFAGNAAVRGGVSASFDGATTEFIHCTFAGNLAVDAGGVAESGTFVNCAFVENTSADEASDHVGPAGTVSWSTVRGGLPGTGNTDGILQFIDPIGPDGLPWTGDEDYRLAPCSPGTDAASALAVPESMMTDAVGRPRRIDDLATPDTGDGTGPLPDAGAFESDVSISDAFTARRVGGNWNDGNAWSGGTPDPGTDAVLHGMGDATLATGATAACRALMLTGGRLTLDVAAGPLNAGAGTRIGLCGDETIALTVTGGMLVSPTVTTGPAANFVLAGDGMIVGDVMNLGTLRPGNLGNGPLHITGDLDQVGTNGEGQTVAGRVDVRLGPGDIRGGGSGVPGCEGDPECDARLLVDGVARLGGAIEIALSEGYYPPAGTQFVLMLADEIDGEFSVAQVPVIDPGIDPRALTLSYTTIDGRDAVVIDVESAESIQRYRRSGPSTTAVVPGRPTDLTMVDLEGDGFEDAAVIIANEDETGGFAIAYRSLGPGKGGEFGGFTPTLNGPVAIEGRPVAIAAGDLSNFANGRDSLVIGRRTPGPDDSVLVLYNVDADFSLLNSDTVEIGDPDLDDRISDVTVVELDPPSAGAGTVFRDIVVVTEGTRLLQSLLNAGSGRGFFPVKARDLGVPLVAIDPGKLDDPRKDLLSDVAVIGGDDGAVFSLAGNGDGTFEITNSFTAGRALADVRLESLSGGGGDDIIVTDARSAAVSVIQNDGDGTFRPPASTELPEGFEQPGVLAITDGEEDGDGDVVLVARELADEDDVDRDTLNFRTTIDPVDGTVRFEVAEPIGSKPETLFVSPADVDADGDEDLIIASAVEAEDGSGQIFTVIDVYLNQDPSEITCGPLGDLDCDGFVNPADLAILLAAWGPCGVGSCPEDLDGSGSVDTIDLLILLSNWTG